MAKPESLKYVPDSFTNSFSLPIDEDIVICWGYTAMSEDGNYEYGAMSHEVHKYDCTCEICNLIYPHRTTAEQEQAQ